MPQGGIETQPTLRQPEFDLIELIFSFVYIFDIGMLNSLKVLCITRMATVNSSARMFGFMAYQTL